MVSSSVLHALQKLHVGVRADELKDQLFDRGLPQTCHPMVNFGSRVGLYSPRPIAAELGAAYQIAQGNRGGLTCRSGAIAATESDLSPESRRVFPELISNYFDVVATWHETVAIGVSTGEVFRAVDEVRDGNIFEFALNPGHFLHYEEWSQSTFWKNETHILQSGSLMQCDIIPVIAGADCAVNIEDGVVLADAVLRDDLATNFPALWTRVQQRRDYLREHIGVNLDESVLPMSNIPMWQAPYVLDQSRGLTRS